MGLCCQGGFEFSVCVARLPDVGVVPVVGKFKIQHLDAFAPATIQGADADQQCA